MQLEMTTEASHLHYICVESCEDWKATDLELCVPGDPDIGAHAPHGALACRCKSGFDTLLRYSVLKGLRGFTGHYLSKLFNLLNLPYTPGAKPTSIAALIAAFAKEVLGAEAATDEQVKELLEMHEAEPDVEELIDASPLWDGDPFVTIPEEIEAAEVEEELQRQRQRMAHRNAARAARRNAPLGGPGAPGSSAARPPVAPQRPPLMFGDGLILRADAAAYLPPFARISKETVWRNRWRVAAPYFPERGAPFIVNDREGEIRALRAILRQVWHAYTNAGGNPCPFELGDDAGILAA